MTVRISEWTTQFRTESPLTSVSTRNFVNEVLHCNALGGSIHASGIRPAMVYHTNETLGAENHIMYSYLSVRKMYR